MQPPFFDGDIDDAVNYGAMGAVIGHEFMHLIVEAGPSYDLPMEINEKVQFWVDYYTVKHRGRFLPGYQRSGRYLDMFQEILREKGLPTDLAYMVHVESAFKNSAYSRARAMGTWQFIASTARMYGLDINYWLDERRDPEKAAHAAAAYLEKLYGDFGDWYLAMAAYNAGEGKIKRALARSGATDFWGIAKTRHIRRETKNYVPAVLAAVLIYHNPQDYGLEGILFDERVVYDTVEVTGPVDMQVLADCAGSDFETMKMLNPMLRRYQTPPHATTAVRVPDGRGGSTLAALERVPVEERVLYVQHRVRNGDTLYDLAKAYGVSVSAIQQTNEMGRRTMIRAGSELVIPTVAAGRYSDRGVPASTASSSTPRGEPMTYRVRRGDTLYHIAKRYGTSSQAIATASSISVNKTLHIGDRLTVVPGVRSSSEARKIATGGGTSRTHVASNGAQAVQHTVRRGDTLWEIATQYNTTVDRICSLNQISKSQTLYPGTRLTVVP